MMSVIVPAVESDINTFLSLPGIKITSKHVIPSTTGNHQVLFFYETAQDDQAAKDRAVIEQDEQMTRLKDIARGIMGDKTYAGFKNSLQKETYLFDRYNLLKNDAAVVIELLKPEMAPVLTEG